MSQVPGHVPVTGYFDKLRLEPGPKHYDNYGLIGEWV